MSEPLSAPCAEPVLVLDNISKSYREYSSQGRRFLAWFSLAGGGHREHWVLRNISFAVGAGEAVGVVGVNGAGKSTLLRIITGTLAATGGRCAVMGRVSAILELGMGFNPELSGRANAIHACGLVGHSRQAVLAALPEIEEFAELGDYFDQPLRRYSSGMQMRLAFSVATAFLPEILIVDEALAVGDAYFQHKSFARIREFQKRGTSLLIVSHARGAILSLCDRVFLLDHGQVLMDGAPPAVMDYYNALIAEQENSKITQSSDSDRQVRTTSGTGETFFEQILLLDQQGRPVETIETGSEVTLRLKICVNTTIPELNIGYMIQDRLGRTVFGTNTYHHKKQICNVPAGRKLIYSFTFVAQLGPGSYSITIAAHTGAAHLQRSYEWRDMALIFEVVNTNHPLFVGCNRLETAISVEQCHE